MHYLHCESRYDAEIYVTQLTNLSQFQWNIPGLAQEQVINMLMDYLAGHADGTIADQTLVKNFIKEVLKEDPNDGRFDIALDNLPKPETPVDPGPEPPPAPKPAPPPAPKPEPPPAPKPEPPPAPKPEKLPVAPVNLKGLGGDGQVELQFDYNSDIPCDSWQVQHADYANPRIFSEWTTRPSTTSSHSSGRHFSILIQGLANNKQYRFHVRGVNKKGYGNESAVAEIETFAAPDRIETKDVVTTYAPLAKSISVLWEDPKSDLPILDCNIQYRKKGDAHWTDLPHLKGTSAEITKISPKKAYEIQLQATNKAGTALWSDSIIVNT